MEDFLERPLSVSFCYEGDNFDKGKSNRFSACTTQDSFGLTNCQHSFLDDSVVSQTADNQKRYNFKKSEVKQLSVVSGELEKKKEGGRMKGSQNKQKKTDDKVHTHQLWELEDIERRAEDLVMKEKEQRKQLKKLKKLLDEKMAELQAMKVDRQKDKSQLGSRLIESQLKEQEIAKQKDLLQCKVEQLSSEISTIQGQLRIARQQKEVLWRKLQLLDANCLCKYKEQEKEKKCFDERVDQLINEQQQLEDIRGQIDIIDRKIDDTIKTARTPFELQQVIKLYEFRRKYNTRVEELLIEKQKKRAERVIFKLNRIILNTYAQMEKQKECSFKQPVTEEEGAVESIVYIEGVKEVETADTFFNSRMGESKFNETAISQSCCQQKTRTHSKWRQLKEEISGLIEEHKIYSYQQLYQSLQDLVVGLLELSELDCDPADYLSFIKRIMNQIRDGFVAKARTKFQKIEKLLQVMQVKKVGGKQNCSKIRK